jgi:O-antigen/teichoic acid export membrane protein
MTPGARATAGEGFVRNAGAALGLKVVGVVATGVLTLALIRLLGPLGFGRYAITLAVGGVVLLPLDAGLTGSTARYVAGETRRARAGQMLMSGLVLKLATGLVATAALVAAAPAIAHGYGDDALVWPLRLVAGVVLAQSLLGFVIGSFQAVRLGSQGLYVGALESVAEAILAVALVAAGAGVGGALAGRLAAFGAATVVGLVLLERRFRLRRRVARPTRQTMKSIGKYGVMLALVDAAWALFVQIDVLLIAAFLGSKAAGDFQAPVRVLALVSFPALAIGTALGPRISIDSSAASLQRFRRSIQLLLAFQLLCCVVIATAGASVVGLVTGAGYSDGIVVTRTLAPWVLLSGLAPVASSALDYLGAGRDRLPFAIGAAAINAVIDIVLLPRVGVVGAAIGTDVGMAVFVIGTLVVCSRRMGYSLRYLLEDTRPFVAPAAIVAIALAAVDATTSSAPALVAAVVLASLLYALVVARLPAFRGLVPRLVPR